MSCYVLTTKAQEDLREIRDHVLAEGGFRAARYVIGALVTLFRALAQAPGQGHRRQDLTEREELRFRLYFLTLLSTESIESPSSSWPSSTAGGTFRAS